MKMVGKEKGHKSLALTCVGLGRLWKRARANPPNARSFISNSTRFSNARHRALRRGRCCPGLIGLALLALLLSVPGGTKAADAAVEAPAIAREAGARCLTEPAKRGLRVLILCDSMGLNGFADELDACFRACPGVERVHTFAACGSNPLSWMKRAPYASASTHCGYLRIESTGEPGGIEVERDIYGIPAGNKPGTHRVPKIEDLVREIEPDILVMQSGNNFFDFFKSGQSDPEKCRAQMISYIAPLRQWLAASAPGVKHFYWVAPPQTGSASAEVQQAVFDAIHAEVEPTGRVIDSRLITRFPYKAQSDDLMHFWGDEAFAWGRDCFRLLAQDLGRQRIERRDPVVEIRRAIPIEDDPGELIVRVRLEKLTPIPDPQAFAPYGELMVAGLYKVLKVKSGSYREKRIVILHPAYVRHQRQDLSTLKPRRSFEFVVRELNQDSLWATVRRQDSVAPFELFPYMLTADELRHPDFRSAVGMR